MRLASLDHKSLTSVKASLPSTADIVDCRSPADLPSSTTKAKSRLSGIRLASWADSTPSTDAENLAELTDEQWRQRLTPAEYRVLRQAGTEAPFTGEYTDTKTVGIYRCRACNTELFRSEQKFESHCGWPSFFSPLAGDKIIEVEDNSLGMRRVEVLCANCGSHLGHVFAGEGYDTPTDLRYCINSISLTLDEGEEA